MNQEELDNLKNELKLVKTAISDLIVSLSNAEVWLEYNEFDKIEAVHLKVDGLYHIRKALVCGCDDKPRELCFKYGCTAMMHKEDLEILLSNEDDPKYLPCGCSENISKERCESLKASSNGQCFRLTE